MRRCIPDEMWLRVRSLCRAWLPASDPIRGLGAIGGKSQYSGLFIFKYPRSFCSDYSNARGELDLTRVVVCHAAFY